MKIHTDLELQRIFEGFGLGTEEHRRHFRDLASGFEFAKEQHSKGFILRLGNSSKESCLAEGEDYAELAPDTESDSHNG